MSRLSRRPVWALHVLIVGLALHNLVMSQLYRAGVRGNWLSAVAAWKDVLLLGALGCGRLGPARSQARAAARSTGWRCVRRRSSSSTH